MSTTNQVFVGKSIRIATADINLVPRDGNDVQVSVLSEIESQLTAARTDPSIRQFWPLPLISISQTVPFSVSVARSIAAFCDSQLGAPKKVSDAAKNLKITLRKYMREDGCVDCVWNEETFNKFLLEFSGRMAFMIHIHDNMRKENSCYERQFLDLVAFLTAYAQEPRGGTILYIAGSPLNLLALVLGKEYAWMGTLI